ncbi:hypothetical protein ACO1O0_006910 [Amphichorda felina]
MPIAEFIGRRSRAVIPRFASPKIPERSLYRAHGHQPPSAHVTFLPCEILFAIIDFLPDHVDRFCFAMACHRLLYVVLSGGVEVTLPLWKTPSCRHIIPPKHFNQRMDLIRRMRPLRGDWHLCHQCCRWQTSDEDLWGSYLVSRRRGERLGQLRGDRAMTTDNTTWEFKTLEWAGSAGARCRLCMLAGCSWCRTCPQCTLEAGEVLHPPKYLWPVQFARNGGSPPGKPFLVPIWDPFTPEILAAEYPEMLRDIVLYGWAWEIPAPKPGDAALDWGALHHQILVPPTHPSLFRLRHH